MSTDIALSQMQRVLEQVRDLLRGEPKATLDVPDAAKRLAGVFGLSSFEVAILLATGSMELDGSLSAEFGPLTVSAALGSLPEPHWSAFAPDAPLSFWGLIEIESNRPLASAAIRIDEGIIHALLGNLVVDRRLVRRLQGVDAAPVSGERQARAVEQIVRAWREGTGLIQIVGPIPSVAESLAAEACAQTDMALARLPAVPEDAVSRSDLQWLWNRHTLLVGGALLLDAETPGAVSMAEGLLGPVILTTRDRLPSLRRPSLALEADVPTEEERRALWSTVLPNLDPARIAYQFRLGPHQIQQAALDHLAGDRDLWDAARVQNRGKLDELAERIESGASWDDLVIEPKAERLLRELASHAEHARTVYGEWGMGSSRGLGITALFSGPSGTGKTLAAEAIAHELRMDLYRIDLSRVVSKYIGETEKNLRRIFDAADRGGIVLLFDEADALFGKRSEVKDSHDRYANIEVSYLLQRMEQFRGLAILTTNLRASFDPAFLRRIRFLVNFPFPEPKERAAIWRRAFPLSVPTQGLDPDKLAQLNLAGGNIRNIALNAAFLAASEGSPVRMSHLLDAARSECTKLERPLNDAEVRGWI